MKSVKYIGFNNQVCQCGYVVGELDGRDVLVVDQTADSTTSITNMIEHIVSSLLSGPLMGVDATKLRVFEHYPTSLRPLVVWQEVTFSVAKREPRRTIVERLIDFVKPTDQPYVVWKPEWSAVRPDVVNKLAALHPALS